MLLTLRMFEGLGDVFVDSANSLTNKFILLLFFCISNWTLLTLCALFSLASHYRWIMLALKWKNPEASLNTFSILLRMETVYTLYLNTVMDISYFYFGILACKPCVCDLRSSGYKNNSPLLYYPCTGEKRWRSSIIWWMKSHASSHSHVDKHWDSSCY